MWQGSDLSVFILRDVRAASYTGYFFVNGRPPNFAVCNLHYLSISFAHALRSFPVPDCALLTSCILINSWEAWICSWYVSVLFSYYQPSVLCYYFYFFFKMPLCMWQKLGPFYLKTGYNGFALEHRCSKLFCSKDINSVQSLLWNWGLLRFKFCAFACPIRKLHVLKIIYYRKLKIYIDITMGAVHHLHVCSSHLSNFLSLNLSCLLLNLETAEFCESAVLVWVCCKNCRWFSKGIFWGV